MAKLTVKMIDAIALPGNYVDGDGLMLVVAKSGRKRWMLRFMLAGKRRDMGLGSYPMVSLKEARSLAFKHREQLSQGIDPITARQQGTLQQKQETQVEVAKMVPFKEVAEDYINAHRVKWKATSGKPSKTELQWRSSLETYAYPVIGNKAPADITTDDVLNVLRPMWANKTETANRVRNRIELILDAAKSRQLRSGENPARWRGHLSLLLPERSRVKPVENHPSLPWRRIPEFVFLLTGAGDLSSFALRMTILTACRTSEILAAQWKEIDLVEKVWTVPASRMKASKEHRVPLSPQVIDLLLQVKNVTSQISDMSGNPYVFPSMLQGKHLSNMSMVMKIRGLDEVSIGGDGKGWRDAEGKVIVPHGFRSSFRDWAAEETHYPREVIEMSLAHTVAKGAEAAYWRGDILEKRRALMDDWAAFVVGIR